MKIRAVTLTPVAYPAPHPLRWGWGERDTMGDTIIQVDTDEELVGIAPATGPIRGQRAMLEDTLLPILVGQNPLDVEWLWAQMARGLRGGWPGELVGGIDIALWDILARAAGLPLYRVLGAYRDRVPCYIAPSMRSPTRWSKSSSSARRRVSEQSSCALGSVQLVGRMVRATSRATWPSCAGRATPSAKASRSAPTPIEPMTTPSPPGWPPVVHEVGLAWFEEPVVVGEREQYVRDFLRLRDVIRVPLSGGQGFFGPGQFDELICRSAVDVVQPDACACGGITPLRKVSAMAAGRGLQFMPHVSCHSGHDLRVVATAHMLASTPNGLWLCYPAYDTPLRTDLVKEPPLVKDGELYLSDRPGLGLELDERALERLRTDV